MQYQVLCLRSRCSVLHGLLHVSWGVTRAVVHVIFITNSTKHCSRLAPGPVAASLPKTDNICWCFAQVCPENRRGEVWSSLAASREG